MKSLEEIKSRDDLFEAISEGMLIVSVGYAYGDGDFDNWYMQVFKEGRITYNDDLIDINAEDHTDLFAMLIDIEDEDTRFYWDEVRDRFTWKNTLRIVT